MTENASKIENLCHKNLRFLIVSKNEPNYREKVTKMNYLLEDIIDESLLLLYYYYTKFRDFLFLILFVLFELRKTFFSQKLELCLQLVEADLQTMWHRISLLERIP